MNASVDVSLTDFIYAVVAGAAFQNIQPPLLSYSTGLILVCFFVLVDDWVLYHTQARAIECNPRTFAACLALDLLVLVLWYGAAIKGRQGVETIAGFALLLVFFYLATAFWEIIFLRRTKEPIRLVFDLACSLYLGIVSALLGSGQINPRSIWILCLLAPLLVLRIPIWIKLVLRSEHEAADNPPAA